MERIKYPPKTEVICSFGKNILLLLTLFNAMLKTYKVNVFALLLILRKRPAVVSRSIEALINVDSMLPLLKTDRGEHAPVLCTGDR